MPVIPQPIYVGTLLIWLVLFLLGKLQWNRLRQRTLDLALAKAEAMLRQDHALSVEDCYLALQPEWEQMLKKTTWFIPHKTELWPMPAGPEYVRKRMNLTPAWLGALLRLNGFHLRAAPELQSQIDQLVNGAEQAQKLMNRGG